MLTLALTLALGAPFTVGMEFPLQPLDTSGTALSQQRSPVVVALADGGFSATWSDDRNGSFRLFAQRGLDERAIRLPVGTPNVSLHTPVVAAMSDGGGLLGWEESNRVGFARFGNGRLIDFKLMPGAAPSVVTSPQGHTALAFAEPGAVVAYDVDEFFVDGGPRRRYVVPTTGTVLPIDRTTLGHNDLNDSWSAGASDGTNAFFFLDPGGGGTPVTSPHSGRNPRLMVQPDGAEYFAFETADGGVSLFSYRASASTPTFVTARSGRSPALVQVGTLVVLGLLTGANIEVWNETQRELSCQTGAFPLDLSLASTPSGLVAGFTTVATQVRLGTLNGANPCSFVSTFDRSPQQQVRFALDEDQGLAVWNAGRTSLEGVWLARDASGVFTATSAAAPVGPTTNVSASLKYEVETFDGGAVLLVSTGVGRAASTTFDLGARRARVTQSIGLGNSVTDVRLASDGRTVVGALLGATALEFQRLNLPQGDFSPFGSSMQVPSNTDAWSLACRTDGVCLAVGVTAQEVWWRSPDGALQGERSLTSASLVAVVEFGGEFHLFINSVTAPAVLKTAIIDASGLTMGADLSMGFNVSALRRASGRSSTLVLRANNGQVFVFDPQSGDPPLAVGTGLAPAVGFDRAGTSGLVTWHRFDDATVSMVARAVPLFVDAGVGDAGAPGLDGGLSPRDGGVLDAGVPEPGPDAGVDGSFGASGCNCGVVPVWLPLALLALARSRRRVKRT